MPCRNLKINDISHQYFTSISSNPYNNSARKAMFPNLLDEETETTERVSDLPNIGKPRFKLRQYDSKLHVLPTVPIGDN